MLFSSPLFLQLPHYPHPNNLFVLSLRFFDVWILFFPFFQAILDVMVNLQFTLVETLWKTFWRFSQSQAGDATLAVWVIVLHRQAFIQDPDCVLR